MNAAQETVAVGATPAAQAEEREAETLAPPDEPVATPEQNATATPVPATVPPDPAATTAPAPAPTSTSGSDDSAVVIDGGEWVVTENDVVRIRDFIELTHELAFTGPVGVEVSDDIGLEFAAGFEPFSEDEWMLLQGLGLASAEADRQQANQVRLDRIRGLCCVPGDTPADISVVMEVQPTKFGTELILMHELVHALHVQHPELYAGRNGPFESDETPLTFSAAIEGVPQHVVFQYLAMASEEDRASVVADLPIIRSDMLSLIERGPARHLNWAYDTGAGFVDGVVAERGAQGLSDLLGDPPSTNEQILFPEKYLIDEQADPVSTPGTPQGAVAVSDGTIGAALLMWVLADEAGADAARDLIRWWAGDSYVIYGFDGDRCLRATVMVDQRSSDVGTFLLRGLQTSFPDADGEIVEDTMVTFDTCGNLG